METFWHSHCFQKLLSSTTFLDDQQYYSNWKNAFCICTFWILCFVEAQPSLKVLKHDYSISFNDDVSMPIINSLLMEFCGRVLQVTYHRVLSSKIKTFFLLSLICNNFFQDYIVIFQTWSISFVEKSFWHQGLFNALFHYLSQVS